MRAWLLLLSALPLAAAPPRVLLRVPPASPGAADAVYGQELDLEEVAACFQPAAVPAAGKVVAAVDEGGRYRALPTQFDAADPAQPNRGELTVRVPAPDAGRALVVLFTADPAVPARPAVTGLEVRREGDRVTIVGPTYAVTHDPHKMGGLPSRIELRPGGKVCDTFALNDRVYDKAMGGFNLRYDPRPKVELLAAGPVRAIVRVTARYLSAAGKAPDSQPRAVYTWRYTAGSPLVEVTGRIEQETPFAWRELHFIELHFGDASFPGWLGGDPYVEGEFKAEKKGWQSTWGGLRDGDQVIGLLGPGQAKFYDGRGEYGTYLHGPWVEWSTRREDFRKLFYLSGAPGAPAALRAAAGAAAGTGRMTLVPEGTGQLLDATRRAAESWPGGKRARVRWWLALAGGRLRAGELGAAHRLVRAVADAAPKLPADAADLDNWLADQTGLTPMSSGRLAAAFERGRLVSLFDVEADRELLSAASPLWQLQLRDGERKLWEYGPAVWSEDAAPEVAREAAGQTELTLRFAGRPVTEGGAPGPAVALAARLAGPRLALRLTVDNDTPWSLWQVACPVLRLGALGEAGADDVAFYPRGSGGVVADPVGRGIQLRGTYPGGWCAMQFQAVYDPDGGLYLATEDPVAAAKQISAGGPIDGQVSYGAQWFVEDMGRPGNDFAMSGEAALEVFRGDWHDAAQIYRRWAAAGAEWWPERARERRTPDWVREIGIWALASGGPYEAGGVVPKVKAFAQYMGVPTAVHWYSWHVIPFDNDYPHYDPPKERVAEGVKELQAAGVKVMPYINGRLWDSELADFQEFAKNYATCDEAGQPYIEVYGSKVPLAAMCPYTTFWQDKQREIVTWLFRDIGMDGVYMDQVAAATPRLCFNPNHGHPLGGGHWWTTDGYWPMLRKIRAQMPADRFLTTECNAEPYLQFFDGYLTWHWQYADQVPAFSAVYADQVVLFSRAYRGGPTQDLANRMKAAQSLVFGEQLGWVGPDVISRPSADFLRRCAQVRVRLNDYLAHGRMLRVPALSGEVPKLTADWQWSGEWPVTLPAVQTGAWRAADGRVALILANFSPQPVTAGLRPPLAEYGLTGQVTATRWTLDSVSPGRRVGPDWQEQVQVPAEDIVVYALSKER